MHPFLGRSIIPRTARQAQSLNTFWTGPKPPPLWHTSVAVDVAQHSVSMSGLKADGRSTAPLHRERGRRITGACPRDAPELPSTANDGHRRHPANLKLARASNPRATH